MSAVEVNKVNPSSGTNLQLGDSGDTITIPAGATFDSSAATNTLPANVVTTDGTQTLTNKSIVATQLTGTITPSDNTVSIAKLTATGTKDATTFLRGDNSFAEAGGGKVLQVVSATDSTERSTTSASFVTGSNALSVSITPSSASNKIIILVTSSTWISNSGFGGAYTIFRDSTNLASASGMTNIVQEPGASATCSLAMSYVDSPSTTSATTYQVYMNVGGGNTIKLNYSGTTGTIVAMEIAG